MTRFELRGARALVTRATGGIGRAVEAGGKLPKGVRTVSPEDVAPKVVRAIERDRAETVVAPFEIHVGAAIGSALPTFSAKLQRVAGGDKVAQSMVENQRKQR